MSTNPCNETIESPAADLRRLLAARPLKNQLSAPENRLVDREQVTAERSYVRFQELVNGFRESLAIHRINQNDLTAALNAYKDCVQRLLLDVQLVLLPKLQDILSRARNARNRLPSLRDKPAESILDDPSALLDRIISGANRGNWEEANRVIEELNNEAKANSQQALILLHQLWTSTIAVGIETQMNYLRVLFSGLKPLIDFPQLPLEIKPWVKDVLSIVQHTTMIASIATMSATMFSLVFAGLSEVASVCKDSLEHLKERSSNDAEATANWLLSAIHPLDAANQVVSKMRTSVDGFEREIGAVESRIETFGSECQS